MSGASSDISDLRKLTMAEFGSTRILRKCGVFVSTTRIALRSIRATLAVREKAFASSRFDTDADGVLRRAIRELHPRHTMREDRWMNAKLGYFALGVIIVLLLLALFTLFQNPGQRSLSQDISLSQFLNDVDQGKIRDIVIQGQEIHGTYVDGHRFDTYAPNDPTLLQRLYGKSITITARPSQDNLPWFVSLLVAWLPFLWTTALWIWSVRMISRALRTPDRRSIGQVVDECGSELRKSNDRLEQLLNNVRQRA
jgi:hypothetical protein